MGCIIVEGSSQPEPVEAPAQASFWEACMVMASGMKSAWGAVAVTRWQARVIEYAKEVEQ